MECGRPVLHVSLRFPDLNMEDYQRIYTEYYNLYPMEEHEDEKILS